jgi:hypothetical protein
MATLVQRLGLSSTGDRGKWTFSAWIKRSRSVSSGSEFIFSSNNERTGGSNYSSLLFQNDKLHYYDYYSSASQVILETNRLFRDFSAWYHIVVRYDSTLGTADDRTRFYVNGVQETSMASRTNVGQNVASFFNTSGYDNFIGTQTNNLGGAFLGSMSHIHLCDGYSYDASAFGETDSTTGEWKIKTSPSVTYGTNGFFILKDGNSVTDQSGNSNNFTVASGTLTKTEDCPSNVFATWNSILQGGNMTYANGNTTATLGGISRGFASTLADSSGKYYYELKFQSGSYFQAGIVKTSYLWNNDDVWNGKTGAVVYRENGQVYKDASSVSSAFSSLSSGDYIMVAVDLDNNKLYFGKNGTWGNSGDPTSGSTGTGAISIDSDEYCFACSGASNTIYTNFGNGYFGTTAVSSAGTNASGNGIFEYDVPTGYTALSTKGLNL